jgi:hypothetical protein
MTTHYTIEDFSNIIFNGFSFKLPSNVADTLKLMESSIVPTEEVNKPQHASVSSTSAIRRKPKQIIGGGRSDDWNMVRLAKPVAKPVVKDSPDQVIKDIRIALNKFTNKNVDVQTETIVKLIRQVSEDNVSKMTDMVFDIVSSNGFYSEIYVGLYKHLISEFTFFADKLPNVLGKYKDSFNNIVPVDPNVDYDAYCVYTKRNDLRKSMTTFIVNLAKQSVLDTSDIIELISHLENLVLALAVDAAQTSAIEEIVDNLYIIITESKSVLNDWSAANIFKISQLRKQDASKYCGITTRTSFKAMDILDAIK